MTPDDKWFRFRWYALFDLVLLTSVASVGGALGWFPYPAWIWPLLGFGFGILSAALWWFLARINERRDGAAWW